MKTSNPSTCQNIHYTLALQSNFPSKLVLQILVKNEPASGYFTKTYLLRLGCNTNWVSNSVINRIYEQLQIIYTCSGLQLSIYSHKESAKWHMSFDAVLIWNGFQNSFHSSANKRKVY